MKTTIVLMLLCCASVLNAEPRSRSSFKRPKSHNYIIERQSSYQVQGVPTSRLIIGKREIDGYRQPSGGTIWFERNNVVGITSR